MGARQKQVPVEYVNIIKAMCDVAVAIMSMRCRRSSRIAVQEFHIATRLAPTFQPRVLMRSVSLEL